jgi:acetyltransferase-like isoleucine patch superfamily enzyme
MVVKIIISISNLLSQLGSILMKTLLRVNGAKIGKNTFISISSRLVSKKIIIGNDCNILGHVKIKAKSLEIGHNCILSEFGYYTGNANLKIGNKSYIGKKARINLSEDVIIGNDVGIGENTVIWTHGYYPPADEGFPVTYSPVTINDGAWVSTNIVILPGVTINNGTIVGAGAIVTKSFPENSIIAGNPARLIKNTDSIKSEMDFISIMKNILLKHESFLPIETNSNYLIYKLNNYTLYIFHGELTYDYTKIDKKNTIIMYKNIENSDYFMKNNYNWLDLTMNRREIKNTNIKEVKYLLSVLNNWGIRLVINYNSSF